MEKLNIENNFQIAKAERQTGFPQEFNNIMNINCTSRYFNS